MSTLSGTKIKDKFGNLLHIEGGVDSSTLRNIEDGTGDVTALKVSTTKAGFSTAPATDDNEGTALLLNTSNEIVKRELGADAFINTSFLTARASAATQSTTSSFAAVALSTSFSNTATHRAYRSGDSVATVASAGTMTIATDGLYEIHSGIQLSGINVSGTSNSIELALTLNGTNGTSDALAKHIYAPTAQLVLDPVAISSHITLNCIQFFSANDVLRLMVKHTGAGGNIMGIPSSGSVPNGTFVMIRKLT